MSVAMDPGAMAFTWILYLAHSFDNALVTRVTPPLDAAYDATRSPPIKLLRLATFKILPCLRGIIWRPAACEMKNRALRLTSSTCVQKRISNHLHFEPPPYKATKTHIIPILLGDLSRILPLQQTTAIHQDVNSIIQHLKRLPEYRFGLLDVFQVT